MFEVGGGSPIVLDSTHSGYACAMMSVGDRHEGGRRAYIADKWDAAVTRTLGR